MGVFVFWCCPSLVNSNEESESPLPPAGDRIAYVFAFGFEFGSYSNHKWIWTRVPPLVADRAKMRARALTRYEEKVGGGFFKQ